MNYKFIVCLLLWAFVAHVSAEDEKIETSTVSPLADMAMLGKSFDFLIYNILLRNLLIQRCRNKDNH